MKKILFVSLLCGVLSSELLLAQLALPKRTYQDGTLLSLGNEAVLWSDLMTTKELIRLQAIDPMLAYPSEESSNEDHRALNVLINEKLIQIYCEKLKIEVAPDAVDRRIQEIIKNTPGISSVEEYKRELAKGGQSYDTLVKRLRKDMLIQQFLRTAIIPQVPNLDKEVERQAVLDHNLQELTVVSLKRLALACPADKKSCGEVLQQIKEIRKSLDSGANFDDMIKKHSVATGYNLDTLEYSIAELGVPELKRELPELQPGEVTQPIKYGDLYYLFKLESKEQKKDPSFKRKVELKIIYKKFYEWLLERRAEVYIPSFDKILVKTKG